MNQGMSIGQKLCAWLRIPSVEMYLAHEKACRERHRAILEALAVAPMRPHHEAQRQVPADWETATMEMMMQMQEQKQERTHANV